MQKKKVFKIEDSNIEGIGTDQDTKLRESAASTEKAWKKVWKGGKAPKKAGFWVWRIEKFRVKANLDGANGVFYDDDSYIVLKGKEHPETKKISFDVHFWLGKTTTQDEYGTAAYKTVELDDYLGGDPIQHRETSGCESNMFLSYFPHGIRLLTGGSESGFNHVEPESFEPKLLWIKGKKNIRVTQVPIKVESLNSGDVFILDVGLNLYQYQGKSAGKNEKLQAGKLQRMIDDERKGKPEVHVFAQTDKPSGDSNVGLFFSYFDEDLKEAGVEHKAGVQLSDEHAQAFLDKISDDTGGCDRAWEKSSKKRLMKLSDESGEMKCTEVSEGKCYKSSLTSEDVFIFDIGREIYVWIGSGASAGEKKKGMSYADEYLRSNLDGRPAGLPVTQIFEGGENEVFNGSFADT
jgi:gelsolin